MRARVSETVMAGAVAGRRAESPSGCRKGTLVPCERGGQTVPAAMRAWTKGKARANGAKQPADTNPELFKGASA